jgi:hypothetical protein
MPSSAREKRILSAINEACNLETCRPPYARPETTPESGTDDWRPSMPPVQTFAALCSAA